MNVALTRGVTAKHVLVSVFVVGLFLGTTIGGFGMALLITGSPTGTPTGAISGTSASADPQCNSGTSTTQGADDSAEAESNQISVSDITTDDDPVIGDDDAPVTVAFWQDYRCRPTNSFVQNAYQGILDDYVDAGQVRVVQKNLITMGQDSAAAAYASQCVWEQVQDSNPSIYQDWQQLLFDNQEQLHAGNIGDTLHSFADQLSAVDADEVMTCMDESERLRDAVQSDIAEARATGVSGTPGLVIYRTDASEGTRLVGAQPYQAFKQIIDEKLS